MLLIEAPGNLCGAPLPTNEANHGGIPKSKLSSTGADKGQAGGGRRAVIGAVAAFYALGKQDLWLRVLALLALLAAAVAAVFFTAEAGKQLIAFGRESVKRNLPQGRLAHPQGRPCR